MLKIFIPGKPQGKERARSSHRYGKTHHYTPKKTKNYESMIASIAKAGMRGRKPTNNPVLLGLDMIYPIPASWPQWKKNGAIAGMIVPTVKPDSDNVEKAVKDALNGIAWVDDCQVVTTIKSKIYGVEPGVTVEVSWIGKISAQIKTKTELERA